MGTSDGEGDARESHRATQSEADVVHTGRHDDGGAHRGVVVGPGCNRGKREHRQYRTVTQREFDRSLTRGLHREPGGPLSEVTVTEHQLAPQAVTGATESPDVFARSTIPVSLWSSKSTASRPPTMTGRGTDGSPSSPTVRARRLSSLDAPTRIS